MGEKALKGAAELDRQLKALGADMAPKLLRQSLREAMKPTLSLWQATMRVGTRMHRTYKGRLVAPGFSRRNAVIMTQVAKDGSRASATVGAKDEAFYNIAFIETTGARGRSPEPKLEPAFKATRGAMLTSLMMALRKRIEKVAAKRGNPR